MPLLAATLAIAYALDIKPVRETIFWHITYLTNFYLARVEDWQAPVGHLWSLAVEEQFYLVWPFFIYLVPRRHIVKATLLLVALSPLFRWYWREQGRGDVGAWVLPLGSVDALGTGALLALCPADTAVRRRTLALIGVVGAGCWLLFQLYEGRRSAWTRYSFDLSILGLALFFAWLVGKLSLGLRGPVGRCLDNKVLQYLGRISYGLYLLHPFVQALLSRWKSLPSYFLAPFSTAFTVLFAAASWHFLEKPLRARGRRKRRIPVA
jgi:peptidoglycan/LPS O-acetylase OafA/YrhL